jgi:hypothetical protein
MANLTAIEAGLERILLDLKRITLQQPLTSGRLDQRQQKVDLALRPIAQRLELLVRALKQHQSANQLRLDQVRNIPREDRFSLRQSVADRGRRIDSIAAKIRQIHAEREKLYGAVAAPRTAQDVVDLAKQTGKFFEEFQELRQLVLDAPTDVAEVLQATKPSPSYGALMGALAVMILLLWRKSTVRP